MKQKLKKALSYVLTICMLFGLMPQLVLPASAASDVFNYSVTPSDNVMYLRVNITRNQFLVPVCGRSGKSTYGEKYNWIIDWGDGNKSTYAGQSSDGGWIGHHYDTNKTYTITIKPDPAHPYKGWFRAFGFKDKFHMNSDLTGFSGVFDNNSIYFSGYQESYLLAYMFSGCQQLTAANVRINSTIEQVGSDFAAYMFYQCRSLQSLPDDFNLPSGITYAGPNFCKLMFYCNDQLTSLPSKFNIPQGLNRVGAYFAFEMFEDCSKLKSLPVNFTLPSTLTRIEDYFANEMFAGCKALRLGKNLKSPPIPKDTVRNSDYLYYRTFQGITAQQDAGAAARFLENLEDYNQVYTKYFPRYAAQTFPEAFNNDISWNYIHPNWKEKNTQFIPLLAIKDISCSKNDNGNMTTGQLTIKFNSQVTDWSKGSVQLKCGDKTIPLEKENSYGDTCTYKYSGLDFNTTYTVIASGFTNSKGVMTTDNTHTFKTQAVPALTGTASIGGDAICGNTLTATLTDTNNTGTLSYKWLRDGTVITGATSSTYTLTTDDIGETISVKISSSVETGSITGTLTDKVGKIHQDAPTLKGYTGLINTTYGDNAFDVSHYVDSTSAGIGDLTYESSDPNVLTVNAATGEVTIVGAGNATVHICWAGDDTHGKSDAADIAVTVNKKKLAVTITPKDKVYDGTTDAEEKSLEVSGLLDADKGAVTASGKLAFENKNVGTDKSVKTSELALDGDKSANYVIDSITINKASISQKAVTITTISPISKTYDGTTDETGTITLSGVVEGDTVTANGTFQFESADAGIDKKVNVTDIALSGTDADNYTLSGTSGTGTASIDKAKLTVRVDDFTIECGDTVPTNLTVSATGFVNGESADTLDGFTLPKATINFTGDNTKTGSYTLDVTYSGGEPTKNYTFDESDKSVKLSMVLKTIKDGDYTISPNANDDGWNNSDITITPTGKYDKISTDGGATWSDTAAVSNETENGNVTITLKDTTNGTITQEKTITYKIDKTKPTGMITIDRSSWDVFLNKITFGLFFKETQTATIHRLDDNLSGVQSVQYQLVNAQSEYKEDGTWQDYPKDGIKLNPDNKYIVYAKITDKAGNVTIINSNGVVVDATKPTLKVTAPTGWQKDSVTVDVTASDALSGVTFVTYTTDEATPQTGAYSLDKDGKCQITLTNAGNYTLIVTAKDTLGNTVTKTVPIQIDKTKPTGTITIDKNSWNSFLNTITFGLFFKDTQTAVIAPDDDLAGVQSVQYQLVNAQGDYTEDGTWQDYPKDGIKLNPDNNYIVYVKITDKAGNVSIISSNGVVVDRSAPTLAVTAPTGWQPDNITVDVTALDSLSGIKSVTYTTDETTPQTGTVTLDKDGKGHIEMTNVGDYTVTIKATDTSDNTVTKTVPVQIDRTKPTGTIAIDKNSWNSFVDPITFDLHFNADQTVTITGADNLAGVQSIQYQLVNAQSEYNEDGTWQDYPKDGISLNSDNLYIVYAKITDQSGNSTIISSNGVVVDKTIPILDVTAPTGCQPDSITVDISALDDRSGVKSVTYVTDEATSQSGTVTLDKDGNGHIEMTNAGDYTLTITVTDTSGNTVTKTVPIQIDRTAPTGTIAIDNNSWDSLVDPITFNLYFKADQTVTITGADNLAGVQSIQYQLVNAQSEYKEDGAWQEYPENGISLNSDNNYIVYAKITDKAGESTGKPGNFTIISSNGVVVDKTVPTLAVTAPTGWQPDGFTVDMTASDGLSGVKSVTYVTDETTPEKGTVTLDKDGKGSITMTNAGDYTLTITVTDTSDNTVTKTVPVQIDRTAPTGTIAIGTNSWNTLVNPITFDLYFKADQTVTINGADNLAGVQSIQYQLVNAQSDYKEDGAWQNYPTDGIILDSDNHYIVYAKITDNSGNSTIISSNGVVVDKTAPTLEVTAPTGWQPDNITVNVTASDGMSGVKSVTYVTNETTPQTGTVTLDKDGKGSLIMADDGDYTLTVTVTDASDNTVTKTVPIQIDKTKPVVGPVSGNPTTPKQSVTLSITPTAGISGIQNVTISKLIDGKWVPVTDANIIINDNGSYSYTVPDNGTYKFTVTNNAGVSVDSNEVVVSMIDTNKPELSVQADNSYVSGTWTNHEGGVTLTCSNTNSLVMGTTTYSYSTDGGDTWKALSNDTLTVTEAGITNLQLKAVSESGIESEPVNFTVKIYNDALNEVVQHIDSLPNPDTASDDDILDNEDDIKDTKILYDVLTDDEKDTVSDDRTDKLNKLIERLNALLVIIPKDENTGISADNIGTSVMVPELNDPDVSKVKVQLVVNPVESSSQNFGIIEASKSLSASGDSLLSVYDLSLIKSVFDTAGNEISSGKISNSSITGPIAIRIPVPDNYQGRTDLQVVYIDDNGNVTPLKTSLVTVDGVQYLQFTTTHFSLYAVTVSDQETAPVPAPNQETTPVPAPKTGSESTPFIPLALVSGCTAAGTVLIKRRKNNRKHNKA